MSGYLHDYKSGRDIVYILESKTDFPENEDWSLIQICSDRVICQNNINNNVKLIIKCAAGMSRWIQIAMYVNDLAIFTKILGKEDYKELCSILNCMSSDTDSL